MPSHCSLLPISLFLMHCTPKLYSDGCLLLVRALETSYPVAGAVNTHVTRNENAKLSNKCRG